MNINEKDDKVTIDGVEFYGHIAHNQRCTECKHTLVYYEDFDAYFCPKCNNWTEDTCSDSTCEYCSKRPQQPLPNK